MSKKSTFDFAAANFKRQVLEAFELYLKEQSSGLGIYLANGTSYVAASETKYEWLESQLTPTSWTVDGTLSIATIGTTVGTAVTAVFDSTTGMAAGDVIRFIDGTTSAPIGNIQLQIVSVTSATDATAYIYGATTDVEITDNAVAKFITNPVEENRKSFTAGNTWEPTQEYNYTQIFEEVVELSDTALKSLTYGDVTTIETQLRQAYYKIEQKMSEQAVYGRRVQRTGSTTGTKGSFGGIQSFIDVITGNVVDASAAAITPTLINNLGEEIKKDGGSFNAIICNYNQARKISAFNTSGSNPLITRSETTAGSYVTSFVSDLPIAGGLVSRIIVDEKIPNNQVYLVDTNRIALVPMAERGLRMVDGTVAGQDGQTAILRGEYTLVVKDAKYSHGVLKNLAV